MPEAEGQWTWWNPWGTVPIETCVRRAQEAKIGVIVKANYNSIMDKFASGLVPFAVERYCYPNNELNEAAFLANGVRQGAKFVVLNCEVEWQTLGEDPMERLCRAVRAAIGPNVEMYSSIDPRGDRTKRPYQKVLGRYVTGIMPMIYPDAFYPSRFDGFVAKAFSDCLDQGQEWYGKTVLPTIQVYNAIGAHNVGLEVDQCRARRLDYQSYTVCHATLAEWSAAHETEDSGDMAAKEELERIKAARAVGNLFGSISKKGYNNQAATKDELAQAAWLVAAAQSQQ